LSSWAYDEDVAGGKKELFFDFTREIAPIKVAVLPLSKKESLTPLAKEIYAELRCHSWLNMTSRRHQAVGIAVGRDRYPGCRDGGMFPVSGG